MVFPYLKGFLLIKCGFFYLACGSIVYSVFVVIIFVYLSWFLTRYKHLKNFIPRHRQKEAGNRKYPSMMGHKPTPMLTVMG
jgi:hypothetical protein